MTGSEGPSLSADTTVVVLGIVPRLARRLDPRYGLGLGMRQRSRTLTWPAFRVTSDPDRWVRERVALDGLFPDGWF